MNEKIIKFMENSGPQILGSVIILVLGIVIIKFLINVLKKGFKKSKLDPICHKFLLSLIKITLYILVVIVALQNLGMQMTSFVAILSVAGLAVSLAVKESLANVAGGVILLFSKPFSVGDYVEIENVSGTVKQINILQTKLLTFDNKAVFIPNGQVSEGKIINYSAQDTRLIDLKFSVGYKEDFKKVEEIIFNIVSNHELALNEPAPVIRVCELLPTSMNIAVKVWVNTKDYWNLRYDLIEMVKKDFDENNILIPYNKLDVNLMGQEDQQ